MIPVCLNMTAVIHYPTKSMQTYIDTVLLGMPGAL